MLLLDDNANITHLNILILGPAHVGKTALRHVFVKGSISAAASASSVGGGDRSERKEQSDRSERSERGERKARNLHVNVYDPTIEDADTVQYVLGPDPATPGYQTIALSRSESLSEPSLSQNNHNSSNNNNDRNKNNDTDRNNDRGNTPWHSPSDATHNNPHHPQTDTQSCSTTTTTSSTSITLPSHLAAIADVYQHPLTEEDIWQSQRIHRIVLTLSDIGGHPFYSTLRSSAIAAADAFMLVYDVGNRASFDAMWTFYRLIIETKWERPSLIPIMMVGNMVDNVTSDPAVAAHSGKRLRRVSTQMGQSFADLLRIPFTETTVMAPQSVKACFRMLVDVAQERGRSYVGRGMVVKAGEEAGFFGGVRRPSEGSLRVYEKHSAGGSGSGGSFAVGGMVGAPLRRMPSGNSSSGYRTAAPTASGVVLPEPAVGSIRAKRDEVFAKWKEYARSQNESVASTRQTQQQQQQQQQQAMMPTPTCLPEKPGMYQDTTTVIINRMRVPRRTESLVSVRSCESEGDNVTRGAGVGQDSGIYVESRKASFGSVGSGYGERYVRLDGKPGVGGNRTSGGSNRDHDDDDGGGERDRTSAELDLTTYENLATRPRKIPAPTPVPVPISSNSSNSNSSASNGSVGMVGSGGSRSGTSSGVSSPLSPVSPLSPLLPVSPTSDTTIRTPIETIPQSIPPSSLPAVMDVEMSRSRSEPGVHRPHHQNHNDNHNENTFEDDLPPPPSSRPQYNPAIMSPPPPIHPQKRVVLQKSREDLARLLKELEQFVED